MKRALAVAVAVALAWLLWPASRAPAPDITSDERATATTPVPRAAGLDPGGHALAPPSENLVQRVATPVQTAAVPASETLLCAGRVLDARGARIAGAEVSVERLASGGDTAEPASLARTTSAADGTFRIVAAAAGRCGLRATHAGETNLGLEPFEPGEVGIELVVTPAGSLAGAVLLPSTLSSRDVAVALECQRSKRASTEGPQRRNVPLDANGTFAADALMPGTWRLSVVYRATLVLTEQYAVVVRPRERTDLGVIDLSADVRRVRVEVADENGALLSDATLTSLPELRDREAWRAEASSPGVFDVIAPKSGLACDIRCAGYARQVLRVWSEDVRVVLRKSIAIVLVVPGTEELVDERGLVAVGLELEWAGNPDDPSEREWSRTASYDEDRELVFEVDRPGTYRGAWTVSLWDELKPNAPDPLVSRTMDELEPFTIEVAPGVPRQRFELAAPRGILDAAQRRLADGRSR